MRTNADFWFPVKRYGWGWGLPVRWQGWAVCVSYLALLYSGIYYVDPRSNALGFSLYVAGVTIALVVVVVLKGERPARWRWGDE